MTLWRRNGLGITRTKLMSWLSLVLWTSVGAQLVLPALPYASMAALVLLLMVAGNNKGRAASPVGCSLTDRVMRVCCAQMTALSQVQSIDLSNNGFQGPLPPLANQTSLQNLNFHDNQLTGEIYMGKSTLKLL